MCRDLIFLLSNKFCANFILFRKWEGRLGTLEEENIPTASLDKLDTENQIKEYQLLKSLKII